VPGLGSVAFQRTLFVGPQWSGALSSCAIPSPRGPRNCGQSPARTVRDNSKASAAAVRKKLRRFIFKARCPNLTNCPVIGSLIYTRTCSTWAQKNSLPFCRLRKSGCRDWFPQCNAVDCSESAICSSIPAQMRNATMRHHFLVPISPTHSALANATPPGTIESLSMIAYEI
jgi:hypothetical protein